MRLLTNNIIENNSSILMTDQDANYDITNIYNNMVEDIVQGSTGTTTITIAFDTDQFVNSIFFAFHNASNAKFVFKDVSGTILDTEIFNYPAIYEKRYINLLTTVRSIEITLSTSETYIFIGNISCGEYGQLYNVQLPITVEHVDTSIFEQTTDGQFLTREGIKLERYSIACAKLTDEQVDSFEKAYTYKGKILWVDRNEDLDKPVICAFDSNYKTTRIDTLTTLTFSLKEAR